jgi:LacI family transcriptional regulator
MDAFNELVQSGKVSEGDIHICRPVPGRHSFDLAYEAMDAIWSRPVRPTAIFTVSDPGAWGVLKWLSQRQVSVPQEVSVLGFEGARPSRFTQPALSTVAHPIEDLARRALEMLFQTDAGPELLHPTLIVRDSTGRPPR